MLLAITAIAILLRAGTHATPDAAVEEGPPPVVTLTTGHILEGYRAQTLSNHSANVFLGVPFAEPPIGRLRFQKTHPLKPLSAANESSEARLSCRAYRASCWQNHSMVRDERIVSMSEDCLYLNVFSGLRCGVDGNLCPVLHYIHGGAFEFDSPTMFSVDFLIDNFASKDIVLVTVPYRLGALGFWSTGGPEAMGNNGLYDVLEGLKWVQREIRAFGGDPSQVTIMGQSSGAAVVSLLTLTPKSQGLFHRAVLMSRAPLLSDTLVPYQNLANDLGCATDDDWALVEQKVHSIVECMRSVDPKELTDAYWNLETIYSRHLTAPRIDGPDGLFPDPLPVLLKNRRRVDAIIGTTADENGFEKLAYTNATAEDISILCQAEISGLNLKHERLLTLECERRYAVSPMRDSEASEQASQYGLWADQAVKLKNDVFYFSPAFDEATSLADAGARVFLYSFDYVKKGLEGLGPWHASDLVYMLGTHPLTFDDRDRQVQATYASFFANFTKYGHPTPPGSAYKWEPLQDPPLDMSYLSIDVTPSMRQRYHYEGVLFWNYIVPAVGERGENRERGHDVIRSYSPSQPSLRTAHQALLDFVGPLEDAKAPAEQDHRALIIALSVFVAVTIVAFVIIWVALRRNRKRAASSRSTWRRRNQEAEQLLDKSELGYQTF